MGAENTHSANLSTYVLPYRLLGKEYLHILQLNRLKDTS